MAVGQFFSQRFGYGLHALAYVATKPTGELTTLKDLAQWMQTVWPSVSETYLSNVLQQLKRGRLLRSHRGIAGGYSLGRPAEEISIRDVVELLEGIDPARCSLSLEPDCPLSSTCSIQGRLATLEQGFLESLETVLISDLANDLAAKKPKRKRKT